MLCTTVFQTFYYFIRSFLFVCYDCFFLSYFFTERHKFLSLFRFTSFEDFCLELSGECFFDYFSYFPLRKYQSFGQAQAFFYFLSASSGQPNTLQNFLPIRLLKFLFDRQCYMVCSLLLIPPIQSLVFVSNSPLLERLTLRTQRKSSYSQVGQPYESLLGVLQAFFFYFLFNSFQIESPAIYLFTSQQTFYIICRSTFPLNFQNTVPFQTFSSRLLNIQSTLLPIRLYTRCLVIPYQRFNSFDFIIAYSLAKPLRVSLQNDLNLSASPTHSSKSLKRERITQKFFFRRSQ